MATFFGPWDLGKLITDTFNIYTKNWFYYLAIVIPFIIINSLIGWGLSQAITGTALIPGFYYPDVWSFTSLFVILGFGLLGAIISIIISALMNNVLIHAVGQQYYTRQISLGNALSAGIRKLVAVLLAGLLRIIIIFVLAITIIGIPIAIYYMVKWIFVTHVILFEGKGVSESLSRSSDLTKGNWWRILAYVIIVAIIVIIITWLLGYIPAVGGAIGNIIAAPITIISTTLIYFTLRVEKEQYNTAQLKIDLDTWDTDAKPVYPTSAAPQTLEAPADKNDTMYCPSCGKRTSTKATFCSSCGKPLDLGTAQEPKDDTSTSDGPFIE
jgi:hypothetical protein